MLKALQNGLSSLWPGWGVQAGPYQYPQGQPYGQAVVPQPMSLKQEQPQQPQPQSQPAPAAQDPALSPNEQFIKNAIGKLLEHKDQKIQDQLTTILGASAGRDAAILKPESLELSTNELKNELSALLNKVENPATPQTGPNDPNVKIQPFDVNAPTPTVAQTQANFKAAENRDPATKFLEKLSGPVKDAVTSAANTIDKHVENFRTTASATLNGLSTKVSQSPDKLAAAAGSTIASLNTQANAALSSIKTTYKSGMDAISTAPAQVASTAGNWFSKIKERAEGLVSTIQNDALGAVKTIQDGALKQVGNVSQIAQNFNARLEAAGRALTGPLPQPTQPAQPQAVVPTQVNQQSPAQVPSMLTAATMNREAAPPLRAQAAAGAPKPQTPQTPEGNTGPTNTTPRRGLS